MSHWVRISGLKLYTEREVFPAIDVFNVDIKCENKVIFWFELEFLKQQ